MIRQVLLVMSFATAVVDAQVMTETFGTGANSFSMDFVQIGNPGNAADTTGSPKPAGAVSYVYNIGKYEVSRSMVDLSNQAGGLGITMANMINSGGNGPLKPAVGVSWNEAARFVNWLNRSKGYHAAYNFTSNGYNDNIGLWGSGEYSGNNQFRHKDAYYFLPNVDEWYKAAYYDANKNGANNGGYWNWPTQSDQEPVHISEGYVGAVTGGQVGPADINLAGSLSAYGTMGQGGNAWEWNETSLDLTNDDPNENRLRRGGVYYGAGYGLESSNGSWSRSPSDETDVSGFRVAMVPEPSALSLSAIGLGGWAMMRRRRS